MRIPYILSLLLAATSTLTAAPWTTGGPHGGYFESLAASASNPRVVYAAAKDGIYRSDDNGATWGNVSHGLGGMQFVAVDPFDANTAYAIAGGEIRPAYRTNDGGATWTKMNTGLLRQNTIVVDPNDAKTLYASADCGWYLEPLLEGAGIRKSTDSGLTWRAAMTGIPATYAACVLNIALDPANTTHLFANAQHGFGMFESFDGAATWRQTAETIPSREVVIDPYQPAVRYGTNGRQVLRSDDGGVHWSPQPGAGIPDVPTPNSRLADLSLDPETPRIFSATIAGLFRSGDGGKSWVLAGDVPRIRVNAVVFNPIDATVMIATTQGVFRAPSPAFTPWTQLDVPDSAIALVEQIAVDPQRSSIVYASTFDEFFGTPQGRVFRSRDSGASWERIGGPFGWHTSLAVDASGDLWFADRDSTTLRRVPAGTSDVTTIARTFSPMGTIAAHPTVPGRVFAGSGNGQIVRTTDGGATWTNCGSVRGLHQLALDASSDTLFATTFLGVYRSTNGCATFEQVHETVGHAVAVAPSNPSVVYRSTSEFFALGEKGLIWRSEDRGTTWTPTGRPPFHTINVELIVVDPRDAQHLWVSDFNHGVWESADSGATWQDLTDGLPARGTVGLAIDSGGNVLHAGVTEHGVWELRVRGRQRAVRPR